MASASKCERENIIKATEIMLIVLVSTIHMKYTLSHLTSYLYCSSSGLTSASYVHPLIRRKMMDLKDGNSNQQSREANSHGNRLLFPFLGMIIFFLEGNTCITMIMHPCLFREL